MAGNGAVENSVLSKEVATPNRSWFRQLRESSSEVLFADVTLQVSKSQSFPAQKCILAAASPVFHRMFTSDVEEARTGVVKFDENPEVSVEGLSAALDSIYRQTVTVSCQNVLTVHRTANFLELKDLAGGCIGFIRENFGFMDVVQIWEYAQNNFPEAEQLMQPCNDATRFELLAICSSQNFLALEAGKVCGFLASKNTAIPPSANHILHAALTWLSHDWKQRCIQAEELLSTVSWTKLDFNTSRRLGSFNMISVLKCGAPDEQKAMIEIFHRSQNLGKAISEAPNPDYDKFWVSGNPGDPTADIVFIVREAAGVYASFSYSLLASTWREKILCFPVGANARCVIGFQLFDGLPHLLSRCYGSKDSLELHCLLTRDSGKCVLSARLRAPDEVDLTTHHIRWAPCSSRWICVYLLDESYVLTKLIVYEIPARRILTEDGSSRLVISQLDFDPFTEVDIAAEIGLTLESPMLGVLTDDVYVIGGFNKARKKYSKLSSIFNVVSKVCKKGPKILHRSRAASVGVSEKELFVCGGMKAGFPCSTAYMIKGDRRATLTQLPAMCVPRVGHGVVVFGGQVWAVSKRDMSAHNTVERMNVPHLGIRFDANRTTDQWNRVPDLGKGLKPWLDM